MYVQINSVLCTCQRKVFFIIRAGCLPAGDEVHGGFPERRVFPKGLAEDFVAAEERREEGHLTHHLRTEARVEATQAARVEQLRRQLRGGEDSVPVGDGDLRAALDDVAGCQHHRCQGTCECASKQWSFDAHLIFLNAVVGDGLE